MSKPAHTALRCLYRHQDELDKLNRSSDGEIVMAMFYGAMLVALPVFWYWAATNG